MIKLSVSYIDNNKAKNLEQAAGFPPFTRGYSCLVKETQLSSHIIPDFKINDYSDNAVINLFKEIISSKIKGLFKLDVPFDNSIKGTIYASVFRTILSIICNDLHNDNKALVFKFYGSIQNTDNDLNSLILATAAQIDYLIVDDFEKWKSLKLLSPNAPVDSLYGSKHLEQEIESIFFRLWPQIEKFLP